MSKCASQRSESIQTRLYPMFPHLLHHVYLSNPDKLYDLHLKLILLSHDHSELDQNLLRLDFLLLRAFVQDAFCLGALQFNNNNNTNSKNACHKQ